MASQHSPITIWSVSYTRKAQDQYNKLKRNGSKPSIIDVINLLVLEMVRSGPYRTNWPNYGPLAEGEFHCHLKKGKPTYVACWRIMNKINKK